MEAKYGADWYEMLQRAAKRWDDKQRDRNLDDVGKGRSWYLFMKEKREFVDRCLDEELESKKAAQS